MLCAVCPTRDAFLCVSRNNPLGMGGDMAKRYGDLVCELWKGTSRSIVPLRFRVSESASVYCMDQCSEWVIFGVTCGEIQYNSSVYKCLTGVSPLLSVHYC